MYQKSVLDNGIRIITERVPSSRLVSFGIWIEVGSRDEGAVDNGSAHFLEHMLFKGTKTRSAQQIAIELDGLGGMSNAFTSTEATCFYTTVLDKHLPNIVSLFGDIFLHSLFDPVEFERERHVILQEIHMVEDTPEDQIHDHFASLLWGDHPLGNTVLGSKDTIGVLNRESLVQFFQRHYIPEKILIAAAGNIDHEPFCAMWQNEFADFSKESAIVTERPVPVRREPLKRIFNKSLEQVHMVLGTYGLPVSVPERYSLHLLNILLGGNMSSRLFQEIREKRGLSYSVYSGLSSFYDAGQLTIYLGLGKESVNEALQVLGHELERLRNDPVTVEELQGLKEYAGTGLYLTAENTEARMMQLAKNELYFHRYISLEEISAGIEQVSASDIQQLANQLFAEPCSLAIMGPVNDKEVDWLSGEEQ